MARFWQALTVAAVVVVFLSASTDAQQVRVALVIGNGGYKIDPLSNPTNDAQAINNTLLRLGFDVTLGIDVDRVTMHRMILRFSRELQQLKHAVGLFYYSGHGIQVQGRNYMIPIDATIFEEADVEVFGIPAGSVLRRMEFAGSNPNIVLLDACRDNPFEKSYKSGTKGLARMDAPVGTIIAYAAAPGATARNGPPGGLSPFTAALVRHLDTPGVPALLLLNRVSGDVYVVTDGTQRPYVESSIFPEDFALVPPQRSTTDIPERVPARPAVEAVTVPTPNSAGIGRVIGPTGQVPIVADETFNGRWQLTTNFHGHEICEGIRGEMLVDGGSVSGKIGGWVDTIQVTGAIDREGRILAQGAGSNLQGDISGKVTTANSATGNIKLFGQVAGLPRVGVHCVGMWVASKS